VFENLETEQVNPRSAGLDRLDTGALLRVMNEEDRAVPEVGGRALAEIAQVVDQAAAALAAGGRIVYAGAGTSGRLGVLDAAECPPTFGVEPGRVVALIAGGPEAVFRASEGAEDNVEAGARNLEAIDPGPNDVVIGIAASGVTPWVRGVLAKAKEAGAKTAFVTAGEPGIGADVVVRIATGPEVLTGSTRLKAGTATKLVLNMISTGAMVRIGKVYHNLMVDVRAGSAKLTARAERLVRTLTGLDGDAARALLDRAGGEVKTAVVMARRGVSATGARERLAAAGGFLRDALEETE
jgi:N-acetylmuramic acid 6-phosphate etherase